MNLLLEPFQFEFIRDALWVGMMVAAMGAVLSCFLILKGWSLMGDAISHAVLPGIVLAYIVGLPLAAGAFAAGLLCAAGTGFIKRHSRVKEDAVMGVVFTGMFAFGLVIFSRTPSDMHLDHILVGNILGIPFPQFLQVQVIGAAVLVVSLLLRKDLLLICFDPMHARVLAMRDRMLHYLLLILLSLAIVASVQAVGIIMVVAMLVIPGSTATLWTDRFDRMLVIATASAVLATAGGILISYHISGSTSACIVLLQAAGFVMSLVVAPKYGLIARRRQLRA